MKFTTELSIDQIISVLKIYTKPLNFSNSSTGNVLLSKYRNNKIYLLKTGAFGTGRGQLPLILKLNQGENQVILKGGFGLTLPFIIILSIFVSIPWFSIVGMIILNSNYDIFGKILVCSIVLIWTLLCFAMFPIGNMMFFENQRADVLEFVKTRLEAKKIN